MPRKSIPLTDKQLIFVNALIRGYTKTEAAEKASISKYTIRDYMASPRVQEELRRRRNDAARRADMDLEYLLDKLKGIIEAPTGSEVGAIKNLAKGEHEFSEIQVEQTSTGKKYARPKTKIKGKTVSNADKINAIKEAATLLGLHETKVKVDMNDRLINILKEEEDDVPEDSE